MVTSGRRRGAVPETALRATIQYPLSPLSSSDKCLARIYFLASRITCD